MHICHVTDVDHRAIDHFDRQVAQVCNGRGRIVEL